MNPSTRFSRYSIAAALAALACLTIGIAQTTPAPTTTEAPAAKSGPELRRFAGFLDEHPEIADQLRQHPALANDLVYVREHKELAEFLSKHPGVASSLASHPKFFVHREMGFMRSKEISPEEVRNFDKFLDKHPDLEAQLAANPQLARDPKFVADHPEFHGFLKDHPGVSGALEAKPGRMMKREATHEAREAVKGKK